MSSPLCRKDVCGFLRALLATRSLCEKLVALDVIRMLKVLALTFDQIIVSISSSGRPVVCDPRIAIWMLQHGEDENSLEEVALNLLASGKAGVEDKIVAALVQLLSSSSVGRRKRSKKSSRSEALHPTSTTGADKARQRSIFEAIISFHIMPLLERALEEHSMLDHFIGEIFFPPSTVTFKKCLGERKPLTRVLSEVEMKTALTLVHSDLNGFGFSVRESDKLRRILLGKLDELEAEAYKLAGRKFRLSSSSDICQVSP